MPKTPVVVENLFLSSFRDFTIKRIAGGKISLDDYNCYEVSGSDAFNFLQGQLTSDISIAEKFHKVILCSRIDRVGKLKSYFYLYKFNNVFRLLISKKIDLDVVTDLEKFIIAEDVQILKTNLTHVFVFGECKMEFHNEMSAEIFNETGILLCDSKDKRLVNCPVFDSNNLRLLNFLNFWIDVDYEENYFSDKFAWETPVANALSISKGCYLGQESVNKVLSGRGTNYFPGFLVSKVQSENGRDIYFQDEKVGQVLGTEFFDDLKIYACSLKREFRINNKEFKFSLDKKIDLNARFLNFPIFELNTDLGKSNYLQELGQKFYIEEKTEEAVKYLKFALKFDGKNGDALESLGVILSHLEKYSEAIECFDRLVELSPHSPMPHTNKSIIFAKMGKIEQAEKEKEYAVLKEFQKNNHLTSLDSNQNTEDLQREKMFLEVIGIDPDDEFANYSLGEINYKRKDFVAAIKYLENVLKTKNNDHLALFLMGKILLDSGKVLEGLEFFKKTVEAASKKGDLKIANEAQSYL